jgi:hypothetical protein
MEFAQIVDGVVVNVLSLDESVDTPAREVFSALGLEGTFIEHSVTGDFRNKPASVGDMYDSETDQFVTITVEV